MSRESEGGYAGNPRQTDVIEVVNNGPATAPDVVVALSGIIRDVDSEGFSCTLDECRSVELGPGQSDTITIRHVDFGCGFGGYRLEVSSSVADPGTSDNILLSYLPCTGGTSFAVSDTTPTAGDRLVVNFLCPPGATMTLSLDGSSHETTALPTHEAIFDLVAPTTNGTYPVVYDGCDEGSFSIEVSGGRSPQAPQTETPTESATGSDSESATEIVVVGADGPRSIGLLAAGLLAVGLLLLSLTRLRLQPRRVRLDDHVRNHR